MVPAMMLMSVKSLSNPVEMVLFVKILKVLILVPAKRVMKEILTGKVATNRPSHAKLIQNVETMKFVQLVELVSVSHRSLLILKMVINARAHANAFQMSLELELITNAGLMLLAHWMIRRNVFVYLDTSLQIRKWDAI